MTINVHATYLDGVIHPIHPLNLPEGTELALTIEADVAAKPVASPAREATSWPAQYFEQTAGSLANENFERPSQGELPKRDAW